MELEVSTWKDFLPKFSAKVSAGLRRLWFHLTYRLTVFARHCPHIICLCHLGFFLGATQNRAEVKMKAKESVKDTVPFKPTLGNNTCPYAILLVLNNSGPGKIRGNNFIVPWIPGDRNHYEPPNKPSAKHYHLSRYRWQRKLLIWCDQVKASNFLIK